jgi:flagellar biosynthesis protein FlhB
MAEAEKPFEATPNRLERARREGDAARSQELGAVAALTCSSLALGAALSPLAGAARAALFAAARPERFSPLPYAVLAAGALGTMLAGLGGAALAACAQAGRITFKLPSPAWKKLDPSEGLKRMFSRDAALAGAKAIVVAACVSGALVPAVRATLGANAASPDALAALGCSGARGVLAGALAVGAAFAALDVVLERAKWRRRLRMTFDELRRDHKQSEGDPLLRGRRRQRHRSLVRGSAVKLAQAAFVVANPAHVAIALEYRPPEVAVPRVLVRAIGEGAQAVKRRARELRIPVVENVALARSLLATAGVGEFIPPAAYAAVAAIVASLLRAGALR